MTSQTEKKVVAELLNLSEYVYIGQGRLFGFFFWQVLDFPDLLGNSTDQLDRVGVVEHLAHVIDGVLVSILNCFDEFVGVKNILNLLVDLGQYGVHMGVCVGKLGP